MKRRNILIAAIAVFVAHCYVIPQSSYEEVINYTLLNENLIVVSGTQFNINQTAIKTSEGIILIDSGLSPDYARKVSDSLKTLFGGSDFIYVINTHHHWDHTQGNQVFERAKLIGHINIAGGMLLQANGTPSSNRRSIPESAMNSTDSVPPPPPSHILINDHNGFNVRIPDILFEDHTVIKSGDASVNLIYYGEGHTDNDILAFIPELRMLAVGDLFYKNSLPQFGSRKNIDIDRWLHSLDIILNERDKIDYVIPGHNDIFSINELIEYRDYIETLVSEVKSSIDREESIDSIMNRLNLKDVFPLLAAKDVKSSNGSSLHEGNIKKLWEYLQR
jgi:glyoxylase-like metal-dependent hydrolase (beta-lactamase superfamily II)